MRLMWNKPADMIVHAEYPFNPEPSRSALAEGVITPTDAFYVRNHGPVPDMATDQWRLDVDGLVTKPRSLTMDDLTGRFPMARRASRRCAQGCGCSRRRDSARRLRRP